MMLTDTLFAPENSLIVQVGVLAATFIIFKQWVRTDINNLEKRMIAVERDKATAESVTHLDERMTDAITQLSATVNTFVRMSTEERIHNIESNGMRDKEIAIKVSKLEACVEGIERTLNHMSDQFNKVLIKLASEGISD